MADPKYLNIIKRKTGDSGLYLIWSQFWMKRENTPVVYIHKEITSMW